MIDSQAMGSMLNRIKMAVILSPVWIIKSCNIWWLFFSGFPFICMGVALMKLMGDPALFSPILSALFLSVLVCGNLIQTLALLYVMYWNRDMPFQLLGAKTKFMIEVIPMITATALHHLLPFDYACIALLVSTGCTTYFYMFAHFLHVAYDIRGIDVFLGLLMQLLGYMLYGELLVRALVLSFCLGFSFYRYLTYSAPQVPPHCKKELDHLPC